MSDPGDPAVPDGGSGDGGNADGDANDGNANGGGVNDRGANGDPDLEAAVESFLGEAETVLSEYDQGYMDADVALSRLRRGIDDLRSAAGE